MRERIVLVLTLLALLAPAGGIAAQDSGTGATQQHPDYAAIVQASVTEHIRPAYSRLAKASKSLAVIIEAACRTEDGVNSPTIAKSFTAAVEAWSAVQHIRFGPVLEEHRYERIAFWPDPRNITSRQLGKVLRERDETATDAGSLAEKSIALQGLTTLERLMAMEPAIDAEATRFRCSYAQAITGNLVRISSEIEAGWAADSAFMRVLSSPGPDNPLYRDHREAAREVLKSLTGGLQFVHERKLVAPLGDSPESARPRRAEFWRSGNTLEALDANFATLFELYVKSGISGYVAETDSQLDSNLTGSFDQALVTLKAVDKPFVEAVTDKTLRPKLEYLRFLADDLFERSAGNLAVALDLSLGFNALDGD